LLSSLVIMKSGAARIPALFALLGLALALPGFGQTDNSKSLPTLTTIRQVRALSRAQANQGYPVRVRAVVTFYHVAKQTSEPIRPDEMTSNMFIQDSTGGNWVGVAKNQPALRAGTLIELEGTTGQTDFAPDILNPHWRILGSAPMPVAARSEFGRLASTEEDSRWVEIEGIVRSEEPTRTDLRLDIAMDGGRVVGYLPDFRLPPLTTLVDAKVRIRGVCGAIFNEKNQVRGVDLFIPSVSDVQVIEPGVLDPFTIPVQAVDSVLRFTVAGAAGHRVKIRGTVTLQRFGHYIYVKGRTGSIRVESSQPIALVPGDEVDAVGFPAIGEYAPILQESVLRVIGRGAPPTPERVSAEQLLNGNHEAELVQIDAQLLDRMFTPDEQIMVAKSGDAVIQSQLEDPKSAPRLLSIEPGSRLRLTGICTTGTDDKDGPASIRLLMRSPADMVVLSRPSWLTLLHTVWIVAGMSVLILAIVSWLAILRAKIRKQTETIRNRLESEAALEQRYRRLFERNLAGVYRINSDGRLVDCNDACARMLGYSDRAEILEFGAVNRISLFEDISGALSAKARTISSELCPHRKDGREIWALVNASLLEEDRTSMIEGTIIEITELKQTVKTLEERTTYLDALIANNPLAIAVLDSERRVTMCNPAFERLFLFDSAELIGHQLESCIVPPQHGEEAEGLIESLVAKETVFRSVRRMRKDSTLVDVEVYGVPLVIKGRTVGSYKIYLDIQERIAAEAELRRMKETAEAANRAKSAFLANMSHEIRTPINGVLLAANLAAGENPSPSQKEYLDIISASGKSLQLLLNDLLDLSKIEADKMELQCSDFSIRECLTDCIRLMGSNARQKALQLTLRVGDSVPRLVSGDALRLRQIVLNLVGNGIKFTERGSVTVTAECRDPANAQLCEFSIEDTGIGIPLEKHSLVFREFEQADSTATRRFGGTGLGLAISRKLVGLMGGEIQLESEVGRGSIFRFTAKFGSPKDCEKAGRPDDAGAETIAPVDVLHILIAEDNLVNRRLAVRLLAKYGHSVTAVGNGREAIETSSEQSFDVILMDIHMPEMDGIEATRQIRSRERGTAAHIPIIAMTASAMKEDRDACLEAGMDAYVSKPIYPDELFSTLWSVVKSVRNNSIETRERTASDGIVPEYTLP